MYTKNIIKIVIEWYYFTIFSYHFYSISHLSICSDGAIYKKYNPQGGSIPHTLLPRLASYRRQPWADKSTTPMVLVHVHRFPNKQTKIPTRNPPHETVGAVPVCPPERPRSGISIPKIHALYAGNLTMDAPLWGDTGGHTGTAPTHLRYTFTHRGRKCIAHSHPHSLK